MLTSGYTIVWWEGAEEAIAGGIEKAIVRRIKIDIGGGIAMAIGGGGISRGIGRNNCIYVHYNLNIYKHYINPSHE